MKWTVLVAALLAGCSSHSVVRISSGSPNQGVFVQASSASGSDAVTLGVLLGLAVIAISTSDYQGVGVGNSRADPELDPNRRVSEQDCTKPIDWTLGNIRCK